MSYKKLMLGLVPHEYKKKIYKLPRGVMRLFGENWAFAVKGDLQELARKDHWKLTLRQLWGDFPHVSSKEFSFRQNLFPFAIYGETPNLEDYPFIGSKPGGENGTELLVESIAAPSNKNQSLLHLTQGRIEVTHVKRKFLKQLYGELGLFAPSGKNSQSIFLYPDGFCICAKIKEPLSGEVIEGWFKLTSRSFKKANDKGANVHPGLELCLDPALPGNVGDNGYLIKWQKTALNITEVFDAIAQSQVQWLSYSLVGKLSTEHFFWPVEEIDKLAVKRDKNGEMLLFTPFLRLLLRPGRSAEQKIGGMQVGGEVLRLQKKRSDEIHISTIDEPLENDAADIRYNYSMVKTSEVLKLGAQDQLDLAIPLVETARMLREQSGLPERQPKYCPDPVGAIWTFTPIENGWLHWPFPDATLEGLDSLEPPPENPSDNIQHTVSGGIVIGNSESLPGYEPQHRQWQLSLSDGRESRYKLIFKRLSEKWQLHTAIVQITHCTVTFDGVIPVVPFAQTSERLLPDHDERALRLRSLRGVSPSLLRGLERRIWHYAEKNAKPRQLVQAKLSMRDFSLTAPKTENAPTNMNGEVQLKVRIASRKKCESSGEEVPYIINDPSLSPWVWTRHDTLACVQTMPLAVAGAAKLQPSGGYELAPLKWNLSESSPRYTFENALDMSIVAPKLNIANLNDEGERFLAPWHAHSDINETGMAVLTQASVTLFPGINTKSDEERLVASEVESWRWPAVSSVDAPCQLELRHDFALRDVYYATSRAAPEKNPDGSGDNSKTEPAFSPLPNNGPQKDGTNSWEAVWRENQIRAGLAATYLRAMVTEEGQVRSFTGFIGLRKFAIEAFEFLPEVKIADGKLHNVGNVEIKLSAVEQLEPFSMKGLPSGADLEGYTGELGNHSFRHGTLTAQGGHKGFTDQFELSTGPIKYDSGLLCRQADNKNSKNKLYSLTTAQTALNGEKEISFWFVDIPHPFPEEKQAPQHWADIDNQHLEGFRWSVGDKDSSLEDCIKLSGELYFEPLELSNFFPPEEAKSGRIEFKGRLGICFEDEFLPQLSGPKAFHLSTLVLQLNENNNWIWEVTRAHECYLQLERTGVNGGPPALLRLAKSKASLVIDLFGQKAEIPISSKEDSGRPHFSMELNDGPMPSEDNFRVAKASVTLGGERPLICLEWQYGFTGAVSSKSDGIVVNVSGRVLHPHYRESSQDRSKLSEIKTSLHSGDAYAEFIALAPIENVQLEDGLLAINFDEKLSSGSSTFENSWLERFSPNRAVGGLLALVEPQPDGNLSAPDFRAMCEITLGNVIHDQKPLRLHMRITRGRPATVRVEGKQVFEFGACGDDLQCTSHLSFDRNALTSVSEEATIGAHVIHYVKRNADNPLQIATVQHVKLSKSAADLSMAVVLDSGGDSALLVFMHLRDSVDEKVTIDVHELPPLDPVMKRGAKQSLGEALSNFANEGSDAWSDSLLSSDESNQKIDGFRPTQKGKEALFDWISQDSTPEAYQLALPKPWRMYERGAAQIYSSLKKRFGARNDVPYTWYLDKMFKQSEKLLLAAPGEFLAVVNSGGYTLFGPDIHNKNLATLGKQSGVVATQNSTVTSKTLKRWDQNLLASVAPWSAVALVEVYDGNNGLQYRTIRSARRIKALSGLSDVPWRFAEEVFSDPRKVPIPNKCLKLYSAYQPTSVRALNLEYMKEENGQVHSEGVALAARGLQRYWKLGGPSQVGLYSYDSDYWISSRQSVAFRPASDAKLTAPYRITPMLTSDAEHVAKASMVLTTPVPIAAKWIDTPERKTAEHDKGENRPEIKDQAYAPSLVGVIEVSARAGVCHSRRLGLSTTQYIETNDSYTPKYGLAGPEVPVHARAPRPSLTPINDRLRANDFNAAPFTLAAQPEFVLYGARTKSPIAPGEPQAVSRLPICLNASLGYIEYPSSGLLDSDWNGVIRLKLSPIDPEHKSLRWNPSSEARATLDGKTYKLTLKKVSQNNADVFEPQEYELGDSKVYDDELEESFSHAVRSVSLSTRALIECEFELEASDELMLQRTALFEMPVTTGSTPIEKLLSIRFEDPTYNDRLVLPAKVAKNADGTMLCADRETVRPQDIITIAWRHFGNSPLPKALSVTVSRTENKTGAKPEPETYVLDDWDFCLPRDREGKTQAVAKLDCTRLQKKDGTIFPLRLGDKLELAPTHQEEGWGDPLKLSFEVTQDQFFPTNPSAMAFLRLDQSGIKPKLSAPLYAQSPTPTHIELVDPNDLFSGVARFRAIYQWLLFTPLDHGAIRPKYMVQKIDGNGGSYLPPELNDWPNFPENNERPH